MSVAFFSINQADTNNIFQFVNISNSTISAICFVNFESNSGINISLQDLSIENSNGFMYLINGPRH